MIKRLPVLFQTSENLYTSVEIKKPSGKVLSDTHEFSKRHSAELVMKTFVSGCTVRIISEDKDITDSLAIKRSYDFMSNKNLEYLAQEIMILYYDNEDHVEGVYPCPRCGHRSIAQKSLIDGIEIDDRDRISDLKVNFMEDPSELLFEVELTKPVVIETVMGDEEVRNLIMGFPTVEDHVKAHSQVGDQNETKFQYALFGNAIKKVNGEEVDDTWRRACGLKLFNNIEEVHKDIGRISDYINSYGVNPKIEKVCKECGKEWTPFINTSNFFDSVLQ